MKGLTCLLSAKAFRLILAFMFILSFGAVSTVHAETLPTMYAFPMNNYVYLSGITPGITYDIALYDDDIVSSPDVPESAGQFSSSDTDDFYDAFPEDVQIEAGDRLRISEYEGDGSYRELILSELVVTDVNPITDVITGTSNVASSVTVTIFYDFDEENNPTNQNQRTSAEVINGSWSVNFNEPQGSYGTYDIVSSTQGTASQPDADGDCTIISWWAPNPEIKVDPLPDTISGFGWKAEVKVSLYDGRKLLYFDTIPTEVLDGISGCFTLDLSQVTDILPGQRIVCDDGITQRDYTVSSIRVTQIDEVNDMIYGYTDPYGTYAPDCYPDVAVDLSSGGIMNYCFVNPVPDENGYWSVDFSVPHEDWNGNSVLIDLDSSSQGFVRQYDGNNNGTWVEWRASDYAFLPGDLNNDSVANADDARLILKFLSGKLELSESQLISADYNQDGIVTIEDVRLILEAFGKDHKK